MGTEEKKASALKRNLDGSLPDADKKALHWYIIEHELKPYATSAWPKYRFQNRQGEDVIVDLVDIKAEYRAFREEQVKLNRKKARQLTRQKPQTPSF